MIQIMRFTFLIAALAMLASCAKLTLAWTDLDANGAPAAPALVFDDAQDWLDAGAPDARARLEHSVYGVLPQGAAQTQAVHNVIDDDAFGGKARIDEYRITAAVKFGDTAVGVQSRDGADGFIMNVATPKGAAGPVPVILMETFCPRWSTLAGAESESPNGPSAKITGAPQTQRRNIMDGVATYVFGRYICTPPLKDILDAGYAVATIFPSEYVPDESESGLAELRRLSAGHADDETRWGAIAAWAWGYSRMVDALKADPRFDESPMIAWGHSRYGKAALVAAAYDPRIDAVIAHQSGTGGASLNVRKKGEGIAEITKSYPHWFATAYREDNLDGFDQHLLLALIAPRPVMLGNARRDVWSDPNGAFRAAKGASPVYELFGSRGLEQTDLRSFNPQADLSFWIRPGTHGVVEEDWPAFLEFLDAHFKGAHDGRTFDG